MDEEPSQEEFEAVHSWEAADRVPGQAAMTDFRRRLRLHQARWREANGHQRRPTRSRVARRSA